MQSPPASQAQPPRRGMFSLETIRINEVARDDVYTAERDTTIPTILEGMADLDVGSVVIVEGDQPVGIITDREIALALTNTPDIVDKTADEFTDEDLVTVSNEDDVFEVLDTMSEAGVRRIPIVDDDGDLTAIVTLDDILVFLEQNLHEVSETIRSQFPQI